MEEGRRPVILTAALEEAGYSTRRVGVWNPAPGRCLGGLPISSWENGLVSSFERLWLFIFGL